MPTIEVDFEVYKALIARRPTEDVSENDVLRQLLRLPPQTFGQHEIEQSTSRGLGHQRSEIARGNGITGEFQGPDVLGTSRFGRTHIQRRAIQQSISGSDAYYWQSGEWVDLLGVQAARTKPLGHLEGPSPEHVSSPPGPFISGSREIPVLHGAVSTEVDLRFEIGARVGVRRGLLPARCGRPCRGAGARRRSSGCPRSPLEEMASLIDITSPFLMSSAMCGVLSITSTAATRLPSLPITRRCAMIARRYCDRSRKIWLCWSRGNMLMMRSSASAQLFAWSVASTSGPCRRG